MTELRASIVAAAVGLASFYAASQNDLRVSAMVLLGIVLAVAWLWVLETRQR